MFVISKETSFEAAHHLTTVPPGHKCARPHGHSYRVAIEVAGNRLDPELSWLVDYAALGDFLDQVRATYDHQDLNDLFEIATTAEQLAATITGRAALWFTDFDGYVTLPTISSTDGSWWIHRVGVSETARTWAWFYPEVSP